VATIDASCADRSRRAGAAAGQEAGPERVADAGGIVLVGLGHDVDVDEVPSRPTMSTPFSPAW
jgi:hypothetical protein